MKSAICSALVAALLALMPLPAGAAATATNAYGGYDIAGKVGTKERVWGAVGKWKVKSATVGGAFAYCAAEQRESGALWRIGWDGKQWQVALPIRAGKDWSGKADVDGDARSASGSAAGRWSFWWLTWAELDRLRNGRKLLLDIGRARIEHQLAGFADVVFKVEECVSANGGAAIALATGGSCPDGGPKLPGTGLCRSRASGYLLNQTQGLPFAPGPKNCAWQVEEASFAGGDYLLYLAASCDGKAARLVYEGGAHHAELKLADGPYGAQLEAVALIFAAGEDAMQSILRHAGEFVEKPEEFANCRVVEGANPPGSFQVDNLSPDEAKKAAADGPRQACGALGLSEGEPSYWKVAQGFLWFIRPAAELYQSVDTSSLTLVEKDERGGWRPSR